jgi:hypothetical protein
MRRSGSLEDQDRGVVAHRDAVTRRLGRLTPGGRNTAPRKPLADIVSLFFPDAVSGGRARPTRRSETAFPDVQRALGKRATVEVNNEGTLGFGQLPLLALSLVLLSSLLLVGALLPPGVIARAGVSPIRYRRMRQPLALTAVAVLLPLALGTIVAALS